MLIKVCGMRDKDNIRAVENLGIYIMGFIFYNKSSRYFYNGGSSENIPLKCKRAGVFVNMDIDEIDDIAKEMQLDYIQLHGDETPSFCREVKERGYSVIKAFHIETEHDLSSIDKEYHNNCDLLLFDTKCSGYGGSGKQFDWNILNNYTGPTPFFLSGGLGIENLDNVKNFKNKYFMGVDLNSKFESSPGIKDIKLLEQYITEIQKSEDHE